MGVRRGRYGEVVIGRRLVSSRREKGVDFDVVVKSATSVWAPSSDADVVASLTFEGVWLDVDGGG